MTQTSDYGLPQDHLSYTQMSMVLKCGIQYQFRYEKGIILPPNGAMTVGSCAHKGQELNYRQKIDTDTDLPVGDVLDAYSDAFETAKGDTDWGDLKPEKAKDHGVIALRAHHTEIAPVRHPITVEHEFALDIGETIVQGRIDLITRDGEVIDNKTSKQRKPADTIKSDRQLTLYAAWYYSTYGAMPQSVGMDVCTTSGNTQILSDTRNVHDLVRLEDTFNRAIRLIRSRLYVPAYEGAWWCSPNWCGYWKMCPAKGGE